MNLNDLENQLTKWSKLEESTFLGDFVVLSGIDPDDLDTFSSESPSFNLALKHCKLRIAKRLRGKLGKKGYSSALFAREIGMYDLLLSKYENEQLRLEQIIKKDLGEGTNFVNLLEHIREMEASKSEEIL